VRPRTPSFPSIRSRARALLIFSLHCSSCSVPAGANRAHGPRAWSSRDGLRWLPRVSLLHKMTNFASPAGRFKLGASQMMGTNPMEGITSLSQVHVRQERAPQHQRPLLGQTYAPSPAPGDTINVLRKKILKQNGEGERITQDLTASLLGTSLSSSSPPRIATSGSNSVKFLDSEKHDRNAMPSWLGAEALERNRLLDCPDPVTPRGQWRKQVRVKHKSLSPTAVALGDATHSQ